MIESLIVGTQMLTQLAKLWQGSWKELSSGPVATTCPYSFVHVLIF